MLYRLLKGVKKSTYQKKNLIIMDFTIAKVSLLLPKNSKFESVFSHRIFLNLQAVHITITDCIFF